MIYISAQPDDFYFTWQLEIQLRNFCALGILKDQVHVLVGYDQQVGLDLLFEKFILGNQHLANFYVYPDTRTSRHYTSSLRPNLLKQHFQCFTHLEHEILFYHDSDVLLSRIPDIPGQRENQICYVSDTRSYLDSTYIEKIASVDLLKDMAAIVGISVETVYANDANTGGAQYILKGINSSFWDKVERDSEALYQTMMRYNDHQWELNYVHYKKSRSRNPGIQAWCSDMWAVLWNLWLFDKQVELHEELNFSWPNCDISKWKENSILHYSGRQGDKINFFRKTEYISYAPWYDDSLRSIPTTNCSYQVVQAIKKRKLELDFGRYDLEGLAILIVLPVLDEASIQKAVIHKLYYEKYFKSDLKFYIPESLEKIEAYLSSQVSFDALLLKNSILNFEELHGIDQAIVLSSDHLFSFEDLIRVSVLFKSASEETLCFKPESTYAIDQIFVSAFSKILDIDLLKMNLGKFDQRSEDAMRFFIGKLPDLNSGGNLFNCLDEVFYTYDLND